MKRYHYIYKTTCNVTNKYYLGMHSTNDMADGYMGSGKRLGYSMRKHGKENHTCEILEHYFTREWLREREAELVCAEKLTDPRCMNLKLGGDGGWDLVNSDPTRIQKLRESIKVSNAVLRERLRTDVSFSTAFSMTQSTKMKQQHLTGKMKYGATFAGKKHTNSTKNKISAAMKNTGMKTANSQYGKCWIFSQALQQSIKVVKEEMATYLQDGWQLGRKMKF